MKVIDYLKANHKEQFVQKYNLNNLDDNYQIINQIGLRRGLLNKGIVDVSKVETLLLNEFKKGIICRFTLERP